MLTAIRGISRGWATPVKNLERSCIPAAASVEIRQKDYNPYFPGGNYNACGIANGDHSKCQAPVDQHQDQHQRNAFSMGSASPDKV